MRITACPRCGSRRIFQGRLKDGVITGYTSREVCRDCGYRGSPIIFDSMDEYKKFLNELKSEGGDVKKSKTGKKKGVKLSKKEKQVVDFLKEYEKEAKKENISDFYEEKDSRIMKNTVSALGFALIITGILVTSLTYGSYIFHSGVILLNGVILLAIGLLGPSEAKLQDENFLIKVDFLPWIAGGAMIVTGLISFFVYFNAFYRFVLLSVELLSFGIIYTVMTMVFCVFLVLGGVFAFYKRLWGFAVLGCILGSLVLVNYYVVSFICVFCLILVSFSRYVFSK
jgi:rRNA maturation protein Nop10